MDDLFDEMILLSPEQINYNKGLEDGKTISYKRNVKQGKEYGLMIGFQKFLIVGQLEEILKEILKECDEVKSQLSRQCKEALELLGRVEINDNNSKTIEKNDSLLLKIKNKMRLILMVYNKGRKDNYLSFDSVLDIYNQVGNGEIPTTKIDEYYAEGEEEVAEENRQTNLVNGMNTDW
ncbi:hypothetical protein QEN19_002554 [Hanseniaspora menglaensis]